MLFFFLSIYKDFVIDSLLELAVNILFSPMLTYLALNAFMLIKSCFLSNNISKTPSFVSVFLFAIKQLFFEVSTQT